MHDLPCPIRSEAEGAVVTDAIAEAAQFLTEQMRYVRHQEWAAELFTAIGDCARQVRATIDGPAGRKYLGPCGYVETPEECTRYGIGDHDCAQHQPCDGNVYVRVDATTGRCQTCGAGAARSEREAWLDSEVRGWAYRASEIEEAYGVDANLIRQWATPARSLVQVHGHDREGRALYLLSQVLDVARSQAVKREERRAARERRTAARAAGSERVA
jgi:hypothetical protein